VANTTQFCKLWSACQQQTQHAVGCCTGQHAVQCHPTRLYPCCPPHVCQQQPWCACMQCP
jgi:hypothetical protein